MEFEFWWLLAIPLFFGLGWLASRLDARQTPKSPRSVPDAYFRGLNFLLNEQPDKAIDAFLDVVRLDPETIELHFALGSLFRRRGETDRAIRVHQNLAERSDLPAAQREQALFEVGQDFLRAGLLDRAEDAFHRLEGSRHAVAALRHRMSIAQQVRDWPLAIELAGRLQREGDFPVGRDIAHFHCELAVAALSGGAAERLGQAARAVDAALAADPEHPRALALRGEIALASGDARSAIESWQRLLDRHPAHAPRIARGWLRAHEALERLDQGLATLERAHEVHPGTDLLTEIAEARLTHRGLEDARSWVEARLRERPTLAGLEKLLTLGAPHHAADPEMVAGLLGAHVKRHSRHACAQCGFRARQFAWQCPGCGSWDSFSPQRDEVAEVLR